MVNDLSCRQKIIKFLLNYKSNDGRGVIGYHLAQGVEENYPTVINNVKQLVKEGVVIKKSCSGKKDKKVKCKYELQPFYYDENLYLELYNFLIPYLEAIKKSSVSPFDPEVVLRIIFNEILDSQ